MKAEEENLILCLIIMATFLVFSLGVWYANKPKK